MPEINFNTRIFSKIAKEKKKQKKKRRLEWAIAHVLL
jgi:hypothetical protein